MINKLVANIKKTNAPIVVGLDPMLNYIPEHVQKKAFAEFGETLEIMNGIFPHWLTPQAKLDGKVPQQIAYDQNFLLSLAAPRALAVASASEDAWADPKGEYLGLVGTNSVYALYGIPQIPSEPVPQGNESFDDKVRHYHCRIGKHDILIYDWEKYLDFAERCWEHA